MIEWCDMMIHITIPDELEPMLRREAQASGVSVEQYAAELLERSLSSIKSWQEFRESHLTCSSNPA